MICTLPATVSRQVLLPVVVVLFVLALPGADFILPLVQRGAGEAQFAAERLHLRLELGGAGPDRHAGRAPAALVRSARPASSSGLSAARSAVMAKRTAFSAEMSHGK